MYLIISFALWLVATPIGLTAIGQGVGGTNLKYISLVVAFLSIIFSCISLGMKKSSLGPTLIVFLNIILAYFVLGSIIHPSLGF